MEFQSGVPVGLPEPDSGVYPDDELGEAVFTFGGLPEHLSGMLFKVPEGLVLRCLCDQCGGREEDLVSFGEELPDGADESSTALQIRLQETVVPDVQGWAEVHRECETNPWSYDLPDRFVRFTRDVLERAEGRIEEAGILPPQVFLLTSEERGVVIPMLDVPARAEDLGAHVAELERRKHSIRQYLRGESIDLRAAALVSLAEAAAPEEPVRGDADAEVMCVQVAPPFSRAGLAPVRREYDEDGAVSAGVGPMSWSPSMGHHVMLDGLFALSSGWDRDRVRTGRFGTG